MARISVDDHILRIELSHDETSSFVGEALPGGPAAVANFLTAIGGPALSIGVIAAKMAANVVRYVPGIKAADKGHGVILEAPMLAGSHPFMVVPHTRYEFDNSDWAVKDGGVIGSTEGDTIHTLVSRDGDPRNIVLILENRCLTELDKAFVLHCDAGVRRWRVAAKGDRVEEVLRADLVRESQLLGFWKLRFAGRWAEMLQLDGLQVLRPGSVVTFTWTKD